MEEQRIGRMYLNLILKQVERLGSALSPRSLRRSSLLPILVVIVALLIPGLIYLAHRHAKFHELEGKINGQGSATVQGPVGPGGRAPVVMTRGETMGSNMPEFQSATLLPGLGLSLLQITAYLPHRGEVPLLLAPTMQQMQDGTFTKRAGPDDTHGALEVPWSGGLVGVPSPVGMTIATLWHGHTITVPTDPLGLPTVAEGGLLHAQDTDSALITKTRDGQVLTARFGGTDFDDHWPSRTETSVTALLGATMLELTLDTKNVGDQPAPVGIGWHPRFALEEGSRPGILLRLPSGETLDLGDRTRDIPNGKLTPAGGSVERFIGRSEPLGSQSLDEAMVHLKAAGMDAMTMAEIRDPAAGYGLRMTALSSSIKELRVYAPAGENFVALGMQTNYDNPLSTNWPSEEPAIATLMPGQTLEWKVRLEIFPILNKTALP